MSSLISSAFLALSASALSEKSLMASGAGAVTSSSIAVLLLPSSSIPPSAKFSMAAARGGSIISLTSATFACDSLVVFLLN